MKPHLRFDSNHSQHTQMSLFVDGKHSGYITMSPAQAIWFHHILSDGCKALSPPGMKEVMMRSLIATKGKSIYLKKVSDQVAKEAVKES